ncbi:MAG: NADH-quinone oxidoreductase subunit M, partial [Endozoicomonadaceae bacterium]|nr:NADH-quinone oxidoreductase subunit M [Endozoicomonadaceae bacterium]
MLSFLIFFPILAACLIVVLGKKNADLARMITAIVCKLELIIIFFLWIKSNNTGWTYAESVAWMPQIGITYKLAMDGFSLVMLLITAFLSVIAIGVGWHSIKQWHNFGPLMLVMLSGLNGVYLSFDLFLLFIFWEVMLIPMYFMICFWGSGKAKQAAMRFLLFTVVASLLMLAGIIALYLLKSKESGAPPNFAFDILFSSPVKTGAMWITLAFLVGFGVKVPAFPLHSWAPDTYKFANPAVTILLAGAMSNAGIYGILRVCPFLSPESMSLLCKAGMALAAIGTVYMGLIAYRQHNIRSIAVYSSISHMNLAMLGIFALQLQAINGAMTQLIAHAFSITGIFAIVAMLEIRGFSGDFSAMGGLFKRMPQLASFFLFFIIASIGVPGLGNFVAEILILAGSYQVSVMWTILAATSIVIGVAYFLRMYEYTMLGPLNTNYHETTLTDTSWREWYILILLAIAILWLGLYS